ncbi:unnamed protein product [Bursaphelenchus xylophilus]|uniref:(pine wood nematode) hypothetical protein n=1 Tax=Bursaphelenchus xylophilus TaxID=6326 RepID=A0A1I7S1C5_BURXY|nr:unnamed protein product [Bursaphelenchus xylophilus]CAG9080274.1 unnamed protein product [Bursaphelenchus xylophilus]
MHTLLRQRAFPPWLFPSFSPLAPGAESTANTYRTAGFDVLFSLDAFVNRNNNKYEDILGIPMLAGLLSGSVSDHFPVLDAVAQ